MGKGIWTIEPLPDFPPVEDLVTLDNKKSWIWGQYNEMAVPTRGGNDTMPRWMWSPQEKPVVVCGLSTAVMSTVIPDVPTVDGMFMSITWVSYGGGQVWPLDEAKFSSKLGPPEDTGDNVTRVFFSQNSRWCDVA